MRNRIRLETYSSMTLFNKTVEKLNGKIELVNDNKHYRVNAKSFLSCMLAFSDWGADEVWIESEEDIYTKIEPWVIVGIDSVNVHE